MRLRRLYWQKRTPLKPVAVINVFNYTLIKTTVTCNLKIMEEFEEHKENNFIKVIGVGGGGGNAVNHMYKEGIRNVSFVVCNTDDQDLSRSEVPTKIHIGPKTTKGLGCGAHPEIGREAAEESIEEIKTIFDDMTQMVFITAGMGGGTGTGAAPVIAGLAKSAGKLTVGIVTIPFKFEMGQKIKKALSGVEEMSKNVDALLVINNERLIDLYPDLTISSAFENADRILTESARGIADIITHKCGFRRCAHSFERLRGRRNEFRRGDGRKQDKGRYRQSLGFPVIEQQRHTRGEKSVTLRLLFARPRHNNVGSKQNRGIPAKHTKRNRRNRSDLGIGL